MNELLRTRLFSILSALIIQFFYHNNKPFVLKNNILFLNLVTLR